MGFSKTNQKYENMAKLAQDSKGLCHYIFVDSCCISLIVCCLALMACSGHFVEMLPIGRCHLPQLSLPACRHATDQRYSTISVSSLPDGCWASVSRHSSVSCSQMLPQQSSDPGTGPADESLSLFHWGCEGLV